MPDTPAGQREYPHPGSQAPGLGFPQVRLVALFCLACGAVVDAALGPSRGKQSGENALLRAIAGSVSAGSVLLADRYFGGWFDLALWVGRGVDVVTRIHQKRATDFRRGRRLGPGDHVVGWPKRQRPDWMDRETYLRLPDELAVREVRVRVGQTGVRTRVPVVATTLTDPAVTADELAELYRGRWQAEKNQADYPSSEGWIGTRRVGYHRRNGRTRARRVVPTTPRGLHRRNRMSDPPRHPVPPRV